MFCFCPEMGGRYTINFLLTCTTSELRSLLSISGKYFETFVSICSKNTPSSVIFPNAWKSEWMNEWMNDERTNERTNEWMNAIKKKKKYCQHSSWVKTNMSVISSGLPTMLIVLNSEYAIYYTKEGEFFCVCHFSVLLVKIRILPVSKMLYVQFACLYPRMTTHFQFVPN